MNGVPPERDDGQPVEEPPEGDEVQPDAGGDPPGDDDASMRAELRLLTEEPPRIAPRLVDVLGDGTDEDEPLPIAELADPARLRSVIESLLLVAERPLAPARLAELLGDESLDAGRVREALEQIRTELEQRRAGLRLDQVAGGYRLRTDPANAPWLRAMTRRRPVRLSRAALETLAVVAYRQPVTRSEIDEIRGVESSVVLRSLLEKELLRIAGRKEEPGRPMIYATTPRFLEVFGLRSLSDLPSLREFKELAVADGDQAFAGPAVILDEEVPRDETEGEPDDATADGAGGDGTDEEDAGAPE